METVLQHETGPAEAWAQQNPVTGEPWDARLVLQLQARNSRVLPITCVCFSLSAVSSTVSRARRCGGPVWLAHGRPKTRSESQLTNP